MASLVPVSKYIPTNGFTGQRRVRGGTNGSLFIHALAAATGYNAVAGSECGFRDAASSFNMNCLDVASTNVGYCHSDIASSIFTYIVPAATSFRYIADIINWSNRSTLATAAKAQIGLVGQPHANFATDITSAVPAASNSAIYVEFAQSRMKLVWDSNSSAWVDVPSTLTAFSIRIEYIAGKGAYLYLNNKKVAQITGSTAVTKLQTFARAGHSGAYVALTDAPIRFEVDAVSVAFNKV
jgi:hypothetical protein